MFVPYSQLINCFPYSFQDICEFLTIFKKLFLFRCHFELKAVLQKFRQIFLFDQIQIRLLLGQHIIVFQNFDHFLNITTYACCVF